MAGEQGQDEVQVDPMDELLGQLEASDDSDADEAGSKEGSEEKGSSGQEGQGDAGDDAGKGDTGEGSGKADDGEVDVKAVLAENNNLRQSLRELKKEMALMKGQISTVKKEAAATGDDAFDEEGNKKPVEVSDVERLTSEIAGVWKEREDNINTMLESMRLSPKYEDVDQVCTRARMDDMLEAIASDYVAKNGGDHTTVMLHAEKQIWSHKNPYRYLYDMIKKGHPDFAEKKSDKEESKEGEEKKSGKPPIVPKDAPGTVVDKGQGGDKGSGWTAAKIDALPEDKLNTVPAEIYEKYLQGQLA